MFQDDAGYWINKPLQKTNTHASGVPVALLVPVGAEKSGNRTKPGCGLGTVQTMGDLTEPLIPEDSCLKRHLNRQGAKDTKKTLIRFGKGRY